jgi:hypothetical protein
MGISGSVKSLTTICSPHHGLTLIDRAKAYPEQYGDLSHTEHAIEALGMSLRNAAEFTSMNMHAFNQIAADADDVAYYSFGAKRKEMQIGDLLRANFEKITQHKIEVETDGLVRLEDQ